MNIERSLNYARTYVFKTSFSRKDLGGSRLRSVFGFDIPNDKIGEHWEGLAHIHMV